MHGNSLAFYINILYIILYAKKWGQINSPAVGVNWLVWRLSTTRPEAASKHSPLERWLEFVLQQLRRIRTCCRCLSDRWSLEMSFWWFKLEKKAFLLNIVSEKYFGAQETFNQKKLRFTVKLMSKDFYKNINLIIHLESNVKTL